MTHTISKHFTNITFVKSPKKKNTRFYKNLNSHKIKKNNHKTKQKTNTKNKIIHTIHSKYN